MSPKSSEESSSSSHQTSMCILEELRVIVTAADMHYTQLPHGNLSREGGNSNNTAALD